MADSIDAISANVSSVVSAMAAEVAATTTTTVPVTASNIVASGTSSSSNTTPVVTETPDSSTSGSDSGSEASQADSSSLSSEASVEAESQQNEKQKKVDELSKKIEELVAQGKFEEASQLGKELAGVMQGSTADTSGDSIISKVSGMKPIESFGVAVIPDAPQIPMSAFAAGAATAAAGTVDSNVQPFSGQTVSPLAGGQYHVTSEFGNRILRGQSNYHTGIDLGAATGTAVRSVADGTVTRVANDPNGYGNWVEVKHSDGSVSRYAHMSSFSDIKVGQQIGAGTVVGAVGSTGNSTGPHLHFEWRNANGNPINPRQVMDF
ncbi:MAG: M23 family metallopeptidase [Chloroflexi bacterium]|nr:M23 family metallopeptidase [Chloroflexota bacterium]